MSTLDAKVNVAPDSHWTPGDGQQPTVRLTLKSYSRGMSADLTPLEALELAQWLMEEAENAEQRINSEETNT